MVPTTAQRPDGGTPPRPLPTWILLFALGLFTLSGCALGRAPAGKRIELDPAQRAARERIRKAVNGWIVWSSSRAGNHDLFLMRTDGSAQRALTRGPHVDWYPRFSPDGQQILFVRSRRPAFVYEREANDPGKWDLYRIAPDGSGLSLVVQDGSWGTWIDVNTILFARGGQVLKKHLKSGSETLLIDSSKEAALGGALLQNPYLSPDGKVVALTLRGSRRATGLFTLATRAWNQTGEGCQVNWFPGGERILWVNPSGRGGSEVLAAAVRDGKLAAPSNLERQRWIDLPGRHSHEYFPQLDRSGRWLVWAATRRGHDHDIADYEIHIWEVGSPTSEATRLTFHGANDRWPDIFIPKTR